MATDAELNALLKREPFTVTLHPERERVRQFVDFGELERFVENEIQAWDRMEVPWMRALTSARKAITELRSSPEDRAATGLDRLRHHLHTDGVCFSETSRGAFLIELNRRSPAEHVTARQFIAGQDLNNLAYPPNLAGALRAFLFLNPEVGAGSRLNAEEVSFDVLRTRVEADANELREQCSQIRNTAEETRAAAQTDFQSLKEATEKGHKTLHEDWDGRLRKLEATAKEQLDDLRKLYGEQMSLKEPAAYWSELEEKYSRESNWMLGIAIVLIIGFVGTGAWLLYNPPDTWAGEAGKVVTPAMVKSTVTLAVIASVWLFLVNLVVRISLSAKHLARDARERYRLTHVYLALLKESKVDSKEREIVYSALFSRSDSGLLKHDGAPTMAGPSGWLSELLKGR